MKNPLTIIVIGGGAAGFLGAVTVACRYPHAQTIILEAGQEFLAKVRISGGGRCNVTHYCFEPALLVKNYPRGGKALLGAFSRFQPRDTIAWFASRGVKLKTEADGRMFPVSDRSETIIDCLLTEAKKQGVQLRSRSPVKSLEKLGDRFSITLKTGEILNADRVLVATGSNLLGYRWARQFGHTIITPIPSLFTFKIPDSRLQNLAGISVDRVQVRLLHEGKNKLEQIGPLLITHWGLSGPAILKLSAWGARILWEHRYHLSLLINWLPDENAETLRQKFIQIKSETPRRKMFNYCPFSLPKRLWQNLLASAAISPAKVWAELSKKELNCAIAELVNGKYTIQGKTAFKEEFVTCGGVSLKEINFKTMESRKCSGLYFAGEILDIDGITGGFNFQSAWTTGWLAGSSI
ncbi:NAD(P)/FAD-dependent oxidoreductase [Spirulina sp. 06S082]|uniref:NAD(P)/FAD-dependent oxidoreductase n=1 Tax=Spirulina sp. 06S082 TaxID=3110248 RepID=UPI002B1F0D79|nr:NAD(P)/FAD-dependent oxidoreductase [Spirulina sp. 06S082]MEA5468831.1 NAD(P)/FAD-dependent oxidoreductase [Spirulina sp. 06S082]